MNKVYLVTKENAYNNLFKEDTFIDSIDLLDYLRKYENTKTVYVDTEIKNWIDIVTYINIFYKKADIVLIMKKLKFKYILFAYKYNMKIKKNFYNS